MLQSRFKMPSHDELVKRMDAIPDHVLRECPICHYKFLSMRAGRNNTCLNVVTAFECWLSAGLRRPSINLLN